MDEQVDAELAALNLKTHLGDFERYTDSVLTYLNSY